MSIKRWMFGAVVLLASTGAALAQWKEPADGKLTDKQVQGFIGVMKDLKASSESGGGQGIMGAMVAAATGGDAFTKAVQANGLVAEEFSWVAEKVMEAWGAAMMQDMTAGIDQSVEEQTRQAEQDIEEARKKVAVAQKAFDDAAGEAARAAAELDKLEAEANMEVQMASLAMAKANAKLMQVQSKRAAAGTTDGNVDLVRKYLKQIEGISGEESAGDEPDPE